MGGNLSVNSPSSSPTTDSRHKNPPKIEEEIQDCGACRLLLCLLQEEIQGLSVAEET